MVNSADLALAIIADRVEDRAGDRDFNRSRARVLNPEAEDGSRNPGILGLEGDERIERLEDDFERQLAVRHLDLGERVLALEAGSLHAGQAGNEHPSIASTSCERRLERSLKNPDFFYAVLFEV